MLMSHSQTKGRDMPLFRRRWVQFSLARVKWVPSLHSLLNQFIIKLLLQTCGPELKTYIS